MKVELRHITHDAEGLIAEAYCDCRGGRGQKAIDIEDIPGYIAKGHLSPLRHAHAAFNITGLSRTCLAQLVRHNFLGLSVESLRSEGPTGFVCPQTIQDRGFGARWEMFLDIAQDFYDDMVAAGVPREDARYALPLGTETFVKVTTNLEQWRWLAQIRALNPHAQWEIRDMVKRMLDILRAEVPRVFGDLG